MSRDKPTIPRNRSPCNLPSTESTNSFWHSQPSPLLTAHRSTRNLPTSADVVIIGSGMTGTSVAHHLLNDHMEKFRERGSEERLNVVMLEAREACWGATGRNGGHCQPILFEHPHDPSIGAFELGNLHTLQSLIETKKIDCEFVTQPGVRAIYDSKHMTDVELALLTMQETAPGLASMMRVVADKDELEGLRVPGAIGAVVTIMAARMWPYKFVAAILEEMLVSQELKGTFNLQTLTPVQNLEQCDDGWTVSTPRGRITASKVVLATNAYTSHLLPNFADLIVPCRGQMSALIPLPYVAGENRLNTSLGFMGDGLDDYLIQRPNERGGHLMFGGGRQNGGSIGVTDDSVIDDKTAKYLRSRLIDTLGLPDGNLGKADDSLRCDRCKARNVSCIRVSALRPCTQCRRTTHPCTNHNWNTPEPENSAELNATHQWTGIMGFSRDDHPWVGPIPDKPNLYISAVYTGHGMPNTWLCGEAVALMVRKSGDGLTSTPKALDPNGLDHKFLTAGSMFSAADEVGLPKSYLVSKERILKAMELENVEARDWAEMERGRRREPADKPHSGYA